MYLQGKEREGKDMKSNVCIKNFTMPKNCHECLFAQWEYCWCTCLITNKTKEDTDSEKRPRSCPLFYEKKVDKTK